VELYFQNPTKHHKQIIDEELLNLMGQVQKLLRFAQTEFGNGKLELEMTEMIPFLRNIFDHFVKEKKSHKFKFNVPANRKIFAKIDCDEFSEVVQILLENAFKYVSKGKKIELGIEEQRASGQDDKQASKAGSNLLIFVRDEGSGIPKSNQEKIFASFFRGESYKSGTGLGLWIAKKIVQQHKGRMWVESEEGKGAEFFVRIKGGVEL